MSAKENARTRHPLYQTWLGMIRRCHSPSSHAFKYYGARGIKVCDRWRASFFDFAEDMGPKAPGMSIERKDNNGNYEPENCCWATAQHQSKNRRAYRGREKVLTSVRHLKIAGGAGDPNSMPACQLDVLIAAEALCDAQLASDYEAIEKNEERLEQAVRRLRRARIAWARNLGELHPAAVS